jgi:serine/threonine protein kinase
MTLRQKNARQLIESFDVEGPYGRHKTLIFEATHLAQLMATLGPPPQDLLQHNRGRAADFWDAGRLTTLSNAGKWLGLESIPFERTLEALEQRLNDRSLFITLLRRILTREPEDRPTAQELVQDPWLQSSSA